ncbi:MAG TPA: phage tail protein [Anaerolineae bacterium]|nr:phage tail protein [Anaerolineae bacterium]
MPANPYLSKRDAKPTEDPLLGFNFRLDLGNRIVGYFTECNGIGSEHEIIEHKVVDDKGHEIVRKIPGRLKWGDVTLKRGITSDMTIWDWRDQVVLGKIGDARQTCSIIMLSRDYATEVAKWSFDNAWPSKVSGPNLKSDSNEFGVEEVTIVHEGMYRAT